MNLQDMLSEALDSIENMTTEEFEAECKHFGHSPSVKVVFCMSSPVTPDIADSRFTYESSMVVSSNMPNKFGAVAANMSSFQIAELA